MSGFWLIGALAALAHSRKALAGTSWGMSFCSTNMLALKTLVSLCMISIFGTVDSFNFRQAFTGRKPD